MGQVSHQGSDWMEFGAGTSCATLATQFPQNVLSATHQIRFIIESGAVKLLKYLLLVAGRVRDGWRIGRRQNQRILSGRGASSNILPRMSPAPVLKRRSLSRMPGTIESAWTSPYSTQALQFMTVQRSGMPSKNCPEHPSLSFGSIRNCSPSIWSRAL